LLELNNWVIKEIHNAFDEYKAKKSAPSFINQVEIDAMVEKGILTKETPNKEIIERAYKSLKSTHSYLKKLEKESLTNDYEKNIIPISLELEAQRIQNNITIQKYFDKLIAEGKDIREFLKQQINV